MGRPGKAGRAAQLQHIPAHTLSQITAQGNGCEFYNRGATAKHLLLERKRPEKRSERWDTTAPSDLLRS